MVSARSHQLRAALIAALAWLVVALALPAGSSGAVGYRNSTCKTQTLIVVGNFSMNRPAGVVAGDVMIASTAASSLVAFNLTTPAGWTELTSSDPAGKLYYKVATASEPASYTFATVLGVTAVMVGSITAFSGVDTTNPIGATAKSTGTGTSVPLPAVNAARAGGVFYSNVVSGGALTSSFLAPIATSCDQTGGGVSSANGFRAIPLGMASGLTNTLSAPANWLAQSVVLQSASACTTGGLNLAPPSAIAFPSTVLDGKDRTVNAQATFTVSDMTDTAAGWNLSATSTEFSAGPGKTLSGAATTITGVNVTAASPNCGLPQTTTTALPITLPAGPIAPAATKIYSSDVGSGLGAANLLYSFALNLPANVQTGNYASTWTFTLAAGP